MAKLDEIKIGLEGVGHILKDTLLSVPLYQRSYAWEDKHVKDLFNDLEGAIRKGDKEYFLGSIVTIQNDKKRPEVVDGQQRLATITILLAAIRDYFISNNDEQRAKQIESAYLSEQDMRSLDETSRLNLNEMDNEYFYHRVVSRIIDKKYSTPIKESHQKINQASVLAKKLVDSLIIKGNDKDTIDLLLDWVDFIRDNAKVIRVKVPDDANAFTIFETLNDRGLELAISDLLKNYLFLLAENRITEVQQKWISMVSILEAVDNGNRLITIDFLRHFWSSKYGLTREKDLYTNIKNKITAKRASIELVDSFVENAKLYVSIINPVGSDWDKYGPTAKNHMTTLNLLGMIQMRPLLLAILSNFKQTEIVKSLRFLVSAAVRLTIYGGLGSGLLEMNYCNRALDIREGIIKDASQLRKALISIVPNDTEFETAFASASVSKIALARYYLNMLERKIRGSSKSELVPDVNEENVNLEHILPQKPSNAWTGFDDETVKAYYNRIGNLTIMSSKINSAIGNKGFNSKKEEYTKSEISITKSLAEFDDWRISQIEERQAELARHAVKTWPLTIGK